MSYMFELFDIVQGARGRKNSELTSSQDPNVHNNNNNNNNNSVDQGESQIGKTPTDDSDSEVVGNEGNESTNRSSSISHIKKPQIGGLNLSGINRTKSGAGLSPKNSPRSPRSLNNSNTNNNNSADNNNNNNNSNQNILNNSNTTSIGISVDNVNFSLDSNNEIWKSQSQNNQNDLESGLNKSKENGDHLINSTNGGGDEDENGADENSNNNKNNEKEFEVEDEFKMYIKASDILKMEYFKMALKYHWELFLIAFLITILSCAYISFYVTFGSRYTFVDDRDLWPYWAKVATVITGVINEQFLVSLGYCILRAQFGHKQTKIAIPLAILFSLGSVAFTTLGRVQNYEGSINYIPKYFFAIGNLICVSLLVGWKTFKRPMFAFWFCLPILLMSVILIIYDYFLLKWYIKSNSEVSKSIIRIVVHPIICAFCLLVSRISASQILIHKPRSSLFFVLLPLCFNTFYGRFFGNTMNSLVGVAMTGLAISLIDMVWKCSLRARDSIIVKYICRCSKDASFYMQHNLPLYAEYQSFELIYEVAANIVATFLVVTYFFTFGDVKFIPFQFKIMAIQMCFTFTTEFVVAYVSISYLKLPIIIPWSKRPDGFLFIINYCWLVGIAYTSIRIINILNGNWIL